MKIYNYITRGAVSAVASAVISAGSAWRRLFFGDAGWFQLDAAEGFNDGDEQRRFSFNVWHL